MNSTNNGNGNGKIGAVAVVGAGIAGMQASLDLAEAGFKVHLIERLSAIGGRMAQLDKTFPTNDCAMCTISPRLVECDKHLNIDILTNAEVTGISGQAGDFTLSLVKHPRYVDLEKCNACGDCEEVCPVLLPDAHDEGLDGRKVIHKRYPQAIPNAYVIDKGLRPPCRLTCPAGINVQGYIALIGQGKFREAVDLIRERHPLPGVCGRVCHHPCEFKCNRREIDEGVAVNALKRFAADWVRTRKETEKPHLPPSLETGADHPLPLPSGEGGGRGVGEGLVAVVGSGPAGLTAASDLTRMGYAVTIFEAAPVPGGMLRMGIPDYRLPKDILQAEIDDILAEGIDLKLNTPIGPDLTLDDLRREGYRAIFLGVGAQRGQKLGIPGEEEYEGVLDCLKFLRQVNRGEAKKPGDRVVVIGGGNSAIDSARTALRLGCEVTVVYRRTRAEMPAIPSEIVDAGEEGIRFHYLAAPARILGLPAQAGQNGKVTAVECIRMELGEPDESGRRRPVPLEGSEFVIETDAIIPAVGQVGDFSFLGPDSPVKTTPRGTLAVDDLTLETSLPGVFAGGDVVKGPASAVDAVAQGHEAATSIHRYLSGLNMKLGRERRDQEPAGIPPWDFERSPRQVMARRFAKERVSNFAEVELGFTEAQAIAEARRCLACGLCSECMQCVKVCQPRAIDHDARPEAVDLKVGAVILASGFERFDPALRGEYGCGRYPNVVTSLAYERILSASGPSAGVVQRPSDGTKPKRIAWIQCVGSRDAACGAPYCSSVCCMAATKEAVMTKEHASDIETTIFYNDIRAFGKGFERYYEAAKKERGVRYVKSMISAVKELQQSKNLLLRYTLDDGGIREEEFDLVVLSVGMT
ncbi:MAG: FAD-dependent oxidoreductase, partial [Deltaproteobacteria bacterium]|nr:FAD-dependent oxidoreductase [Deltaproteobacteria bacterium]